MLHAHQAETPLLFDYLCVQEIRQHQPHRFLLTIADYPFSEVRCQPIVIMLQPIRAEYWYTVCFQSALQLMYH